MFNRPMHLPYVLPRTTQAGPELIKLKDRRGSEFCLGPTHEEAFSDVVANELESFKQLPWRL